MPYFDEDFILFLNELKENNTREWFHSQKKRYEKNVKEPFKQFCQIMIDEVLGEKAFVKQIEPKHCIFRINRDIRFSKDKSPYKTQLGMVISENGKKDATFPSMYLEFSGSHLRLYSGSYMLDKNQLQSLREKIFENPKRFEKLLNEKKFKETFGTLRGDKNKRIPKPFTEIQETYPFILNKQFYYFKEYPAEFILNENLKETLMNDFSFAKPLNSFINESLGQ
ncbi:MAG: DUF2461 domain-containing protein [Flavobacteriales bacterium]|jgi:uncharacterized protein (TIGR02453 family)|nr:DUF2461 domain-containing protein [Flavobacteriales bacterium]